jgi:hypothetical protein
MFITLLERIKLIYNFIHFQIKFSINFDLIFTNFKCKIKINHLIF